MITVVQFEGTLRRSRGLKMAFKHVSIQELQIKPVLEKDGFHSLR